ncbi:MAG: hypothetical protein JKY94_01655 [Rhodobacteraceae bacterium]|nr:hypothetical protein [Paracoccaceae bacterium]
MLKTDAIALFGTGLKPIATALGVTPARISQLPAILPREYVDRIVGAALRTGVDEKKLLQMLKANPEASDQSEVRA